MTDLTDRQLERYARHVILDEVGEEGQGKLLAARVLVVGAGGLGAPLLLYLAAAGIGTLGLIDDDAVDLSNLQRQVIHDEAAIGQPKVESAAARIRALNPDITLEVMRARLDAGNADEIIARFDIVADGSDNFTTRYLLNDVCFRQQKTLVSAALLRFDAQLSTFKAHLGDPHPCYRCLFPEQPPEDFIPRCETAGILGSVAGVMGALQATEVLKEVLGLGDSLSGRLLMYDALGPQFREVRFKRDPGCPTCGH
ncbi:adenylyltransferase/sulfurtransferase [Dongia mobilis]|uniref:Molybdopterin-synthase adenylyltransferase n=1 Tax=Dongia mobilis TaxID=578943 RepID=A0A4R6WSY8_9PROT|nr:molybdopterin-synthase adenylyltransferase MoeB [Dongia mobilis]TDQ86366.1 adenylyltransferase/sulfurtransferase [Dongia mobilis]